MIEKILLRGWSEAGCPKRGMASIIINLQQTTVGPTKARRLFCGGEVGGGRIGAGMGNKAGFSIPRQRGGPIRRIFFLINIRGAAERGRAKFFH